jgi:tape measure domain-containing protein
MDMALNIHDNSTNVLQQVSNEMSIVINRYQILNQVTQDPLNADAIKDAQDKLGQTLDAVNGIKEGVDELAGKQEELTEEEERSKAAAELLDAAISKINIGDIASKLIEMADAFTENTNRLSAMNDGLQTTEELSGKISAAAQRSRSSYDELLSTVTALRGASVLSTNDEQVAFAEQLNKQFALSSLSAADQAAAMDQVTAAMVAGTVQGDALNTIMNNTPGLAQSLADQLGVGVDELQNLAEQGNVSSAALKNAMFATMDETNAAFAEMPWTWAEVWQLVITAVQELFAPLIEFIAGAATWIGEHWSILEPILTGLAAAVGVLTAALLIYKIYTTIATIAQTLFNGALGACPLLLIVMGIMLVITAIVAFVRSVGGLKVAWLMTMNALKTAWDNYLIRLFTGGLAIFKFILQMQLVFFRAKNAIVGFILDMSVKVVEFLQDMVNGAIGVINKFIELLNKIPGVAISAIEEVTFAATFAAKVETTKANMEEGYALQEAAHNESIANMTQLLDNFKTDAADREQDRLNEIAEAQEDAQGDGEDGLDTDPSELPEGGGSGDDGGGGGGAVAANTGATAGNTAAMLDSIDLANEELKYLRELAEQEAINRFTTAEIKVEMQNDNYISSDTDIDGIVNLLSESLEEAMAAAAEGA